MMGMYDIDIATSHQTAERLDQKRIQDEQLRVRGARLAVLVPTQVTNAVNMERFRFSGATEVIGYDVYLMASLCQSLGQPSDTNGRAPSIGEGASGYDRNAQSGARRHDCRPRAAIRGHSRSAQPRLAE